MTGPPYPVAGSNAIGSFKIGISPVGDVPIWNPWTTVISQYANSPIIDGLILSQNAALDQTKNIDNFFDFMFNPITAVGYGLDCIGRIVGVSRTIPIPSGAAAYFGFDEATGSWTGFGQGGFFSGAGVTNNFILSDADFRTLIFAKMLGNISDGSIPSINNILLTLFGSNAHVQDNLNMTMVYVFTVVPTPVQLAIVSLSGVLPSPAGVVVTISHP